MKTLYNIPLAWHVKNRWNSIFKYWFNEVLVIWIYLPFLPPPSPLISGNDDSNNNPPLISIYIFFYFSVSSDSDGGNHENVSQLDLQPCFRCNRTFLPPALEKHVGICEKMNFKKRKPFDSYRQRLEGTDLANYFPPNYSTSKNDAPKMSKSHTFTAGVIKHRTPLNQIDFERKNERTSPAQDHFVTKPVKRATLAPVSELCPHCDRSFGIKAYDRHVEWCKEKSRLKNPGTTRQLSIAKERLEARTKYRAPNVRWVNSIY